MKCLHTHVWRKACRDPSHISEVINGPFNDIGANFLIHGTAKPQPQHALNAEYDSTPTEEAVGTLTVEMLDLIFQ